MANQTINIILEPIYTRKGSLYSIEKFIRFQELKLFIIPKIKKLSRQNSLKIFSTDKEIISFLKSQEIEDVFQLKQDGNKSIDISKNVKKIVNRLFQEENVRKTLYFDGIDIKTILEYEIAIKLYESYNKISSYENALDETTGTIYLESSNSPTGKIIDYIARKHNIQLKYLNANIFRKTKDKIVDMMNYRDLNYLKDLNIYSKKSKITVQKIILVDAVYVNYLRNIIPVIKKMSEGFQFYFISKEEDLKSFNMEFDVITKFNPEWVKNENIELILDTLFSDENLQKAFENENDIYLFKEELYNLFESRLPYLLFKLRLSSSFINKASPDILIVGDDRSTITRTCILPAKENKIPVVEIQHGLFSLPEIFVNLMPEPISDKICVWGNSSRKYLLELGFEDKKIEITGSPEFDEHKKFAESFEDKENKIILFATQAPYKSTNLEVIEEMGKNNKLDEFIVYVKPHPDEDPVSYKFLEDKFPGKVFIRQKNENISHLLAISDIILTISSTVGLESAILDKPLICVNFLNEKSMYVDDGIALEVKNIGELSKSIIDVLNPEIAAELSENRTKFVNEYVYGLDGKSTERIMNVIIDLLDKKSN
ncbi:UDP-N-acetylglucosamine 2-epimerase [Methanobacterium sp.]|uniref:UDP-N-acetylglucosamine 2-epimerase n=1 Tax=Methanobacterium sp. TaxID=2164 RepID=UPI003C7642AB